MLIEDFIIKKIEWWHLAMIYLWHLYEFYRWFDFYFQFLFREHMQPSKAKVHIIQMKF